MNSNNVASVSCVGVGGSNAGFGSGTARKAGFLGVRGV